MAAAAGAPASCPSAAAAPGKNKQVDSKPLARGVSGHMAPCPWSQVSPASGHSPSFAVAVFPSQTRVKMLRDALSPVSRDVAGPLLSSVSTQGVTTCGWPGCCGAAWAVRGASLRPGTVLAQLSVPWGAAPMRHRSPLVCAAVALVGARLGVGSAGVAAVLGPCGLLDPCSS